jgi:hypothetical protein
VASQTLDRITIGTADDGIVVYYDNTVCAHVDVQLDPVSAGLERQLERCQRVLARLPRHATMSD